jgi:hypothetical protein
VFYEEVVCYGIIQSLSWSLPTLIHCSKKSELKKESQRGFVIDDSPATSEMVSSLSRLSQSRFSNSLYKIMCAYHDAWLGHSTWVRAAQELWSASKNRRKCRTETSNSMTKAMFSSARGQVCRAPFPPPLYCCVGFWDSFVGHK